MKTIRIRQNKLKKKKKTLLAIDKIFITYKDKIVNFELEQGTSKRGKKSKKPQSKISVGEKSLGVWKKKTKVDESLGDIVMKTINAKTISVEVDMLGFKLEVTRGSIFFKLKLIIDNKLRDHSGLCKWVPSSITDIPYGEYESYSLPEPLSDAQSGTDTEVGKDFSSSDYFDISNVAGKESGYALCCSDASVNAKQFQLFNDDELTVSFYLKSCPDCYGVVFSYKANNEVPISLDNMKNGLEISYGKKKTYRSDIQLEKNVWHFIALTWSKRLKEINLYVIAENKPSNPKTFKIEKFVGKPFLKGGALSLGKFQISGQEKKWKKPNEFVGCYDSLGFAYIALTLTQVQSLYSKSPSSVKSYLGSSNFYYYDFDEDPYESNGYLENDLSDGEIEGLFKGMASQFKIENKKPLNNCYQRTSDAPITDSSIEQTYNVKSARRRRSLQLDDREITHVLRFAANKMDRVRRATVTYDYNALCDRVFTSTSSSSLASTCSETVMLPTRSVALWECYDANGDGDDIADAIGGFASDCETTLGLNYFPATETCREFEDDFNLYPYMGEVCSPNCSFGGIESSSSQCKCDDGYWDSSCSSVCPGGATNPCNGFDTCDQVTGECRCPINMQGSDNCTICSPGWYGDDCEITDNEAESGLNTSLALLGQLGNVYTLDGLTYPIKTQGELLLLAISDNIVIQGKFITCYTNYSCTPFISARIGDSSNGFATITVQSSIYYNEKPYVYINEVQTVLDTAAFFRGFKIYRSNFFEVTIDVKDIILFTVRTVGQYLHLSTKMDNLIVSKTSGLLSGGLHTDTVAKMDHLYNSSYTEFAICNDTALSQSVLGSESSNVLALTSYTQAFGNDLTFSTTRFEVTECDCVIYYPEAGFKNQTVGGYSLSFSKSSIHHENFEIDTSLYSELTFEIQVKTDTGNDSGVLFAFTSDMGFAMISGSTSLEIHTFIDNNHTIHDTELSMDASDWNKIVFTYDTATGESYVYVIYGNGATSSTGSFELPSTIFNSPGTLSVGQWQAPSSASQYLFQNGFEGDLENFMIWSLIIEESQISQLHQMNPALASAMLIYSLQFNEGNGDTTMDSISSSNLKLPTYPWKAPEWKVSDLVYTSDDLSYLAFSFFTDKTLQSEANDLCGNALFDTNCVGMSNATLEVFYIECMQAISATKDLTSGYNAVLDAYTICESQNTFSSSEIVTFCASLDDEDRNGTSCTTSCPFGTVFANGTCSCFNGYYGTQCDSVCPGSSDSPCNDHGECQTDGACDCWWNWNGDSSCSSCSSDSNGDMTGPDCIILETTSLSSSSSKIGAVSSNGYFMTFDGQQISFVGETGAFILFSSSTLGVDIHVYQVGCSYGSCVAALSLESATTSVVIAPPGSGYAPIVYKNGEQITLDDTTVSIDNYITVSQDSLTDISVSITTLGTITVKVVVQEEFLQASVYTAPTVCQSATGILGACGSGTDYKTMTEAEIVEYIVDNFRLSSSVIFDALNAPVGNGTTITGYAIKFNKNSVMTKPLAYPSGFSLNELDFSLSLYWKPSSYGGFIVSYGKDIAFTIINTSPLKLQCQETVLETAVIPELDVWNQLVLTFRQQNGTIDLFHFGADSKITNEVLTFECMGLFEEGGTVMLGEYMPATESAYTYNTDFFVGVIDEVSVWKNPIPNTLIYQAHLLSTKVSGFTSELSQLISFTEGVGTVAYDEINGNNLILPNSPWQSPEWFVSDLGLQDLRSIDSSRYSTNNIDSEVEALCSVFFDDSAVTSDCSRVSSFIVWWYKQNCMITATLSGNVTDVTMSMVDYTSVCEVTGGSTDSLYDIICNLGIITQGWLNQKCSGCLFGYKEDGNCICYHGYYGTTCESVCPGGAATPCSGNGVCDNSGACQCSGRFDGTECNTCLTGWTGDECTIMKQAGFDPMNSVNTTILVAQVNLLGQLAMFDGAVVDMPLSGYYELMALASLDISLQGRFAVCESASILLSCMIGVVIEHKGIEYYISHEAYDQVSSVEIMTAVSTLTLYDSLELGDIFMKLESKATIKITMAGTDLAIKLSSISDRLLSTIALPKTEWETFKHDLSGIVTACDTEIAITAVNCSDVVRQDLCNSSFTIPTECEIPQTKDSLSEFISQQSYSNTGFMDFVEQKYLSPLEPNCLKYSGGNGMTASNVSLPSSDFALEMHVKPNQTGGILMTFDTNGDYVVLLNHDLTDQLVLHTAAKNYFTGLQLTVDDWNQISLAWRDASGVMEIYLADAEGVFTVYAAEIPDVFGGPGTLTLGQVTPGLSASISAGDFNGFIDEVRVWSRRHNPSVITENFRITVTDTTSDVSHSWNFNEGTGMSAYEHFSGSAMVPVSVAEAPKWVKSTLDLSQKQEFDIPQMTSSDTQNAEALAAAVDTCSNLIGEFSLNAVSSDMDTLMSVYEALCVQEIVNSNDTEQAAAIMASMADLYTSLTNSTDSPIQGLCNVIESLSSYIGAGGANCTSCNFGNFNEDGVCVCLDSHWGNSCDTICPVTDNGACNSHGVCDTVSGECNCHPRHYSGESTVEDYWKKFISGESLSVDAEYACGICSGDWVGKECAFAKATSTATELLTGMAYGSYLTTFGGMSFVHVSPGTYTLLKTDTVEVQALFIPCIGDNACRTMTELAMTSGTDSVHVQHSADGGNITVIVKEDGDIEYLSYPTEESFGSIQVKWTEHLYIELKSQGSSFVAYDSPLGLITNAQVPSGQVSSNNGLLGNLGDDWVSDIKCPNDNDDLTEEDVTVAYAGECIRKKYMPGNSFIDHEYGSQRLTSGGYSLRLSNNTGFAVENLTVDTGISDISFGFWAKAESSSNKRSTSSFTVLTVDAGIADIVFRVDSGYLVLDWGSTYETGIVFTPNTWQYLALTWANDGLAAVYVITEDTVQSKDPLDGLLHVGSTVDVQSLYMTAPTADMVTVDCIRSWKERKSLSESDTDSKSYCGPTSQTDKTLMLAVPFDEGNGTDISVLIYDTDANAATGTVKATLNGLVVLGSL
ncbi:hypothetical protein MAR_012003 [Mya arenaria]|uniref:EGF-like domain-containing protein n=1 Tax=Mya arenaria TaxID=6604 RepID=A0ABY7FZC5_MYAAR|nr:hypothetical protein MAR_012003 [Mya arenaria]